MGALHAGHLALVKKSKAENDLTVVSIFVNPTQFNDPNDLKNYPRTMAEDEEKLRSVGADYLLSPEYQELYPDSYRYFVDESEFSQILCGSSRPGHFRGVLSVVMKLLNLVRADRAYFGEKDFQQLKLIEGMVEAFFMKTKIVPCATVREQDGLAMSSRNRRLSAQERELAPAFYRILTTMKSLDEAKAELGRLGFEVDYLEEHVGRRFGAVKLGAVRLIDNVAIGGSTS